MMAGSLKARAKSHEFAIRDCNRNPMVEIPMADRRVLPPGAEINWFRQLPDEVLGEILLRLPGDSLKNCKRVCKSWFKLINEPSFINKHLGRITSKESKLPRAIFLKWIRRELSLEEDIFNPDATYFHHANDPSKLVLSLLTIEDDNGKGDDLPRVIEQVHLPPIPEGEQQDFPTNFRALHCNGIIHMYDNLKDRIAVLFNPALREFKLLREPELPLSSDFNSFLGCGFGYDPKDNVYKYVKIFGDSSCENPIALVHTLGMNSWRKISVGVVGYYGFLHSNGVYCKGACYWRNMPGIEETVLSFNMSEEKFHNIPYPNDDHQRKIYFRVLDAWKESIVLFNCTESSWFSTSLEMWVMVENFGGVEGSTHWIKHLKIGPLPNLNSPLAFWKEDELLMETRDGRILSYNLYTQKIRKVPLPGAVYPGLTYASLCLKSLISV